MMKQILEDASKAELELCVVLLHYFNPISAHASSRLVRFTGHPEQHHALCGLGAVEYRDHLTILGSDYRTPDNTCRRDHISVVDLVDGHAKTVEFTAPKEHGSLQPRHWYALQDGGDKSKPLGVAMPSQ